MKKVLTLVLFFVSLSLFAQDFEYKWERVRMDKTYDGDGKSNVEKIINQYSPQMEPLMEILAYSNGEMVKKGPESGLPNLAADVILATSKKFVKNDYPIVSLTNYGGIRMSFPKGAIRVYDVVSTFPFNNKIVVVQVKGSELLKLYSRFASKSRFEALGGVRIEVEHGEVSKCIIAGQPLDKNKIYNLATIDFILGGGDKLNIKRVDDTIVETGVLLSDAVIAYLKELNADKITLSPKGDGRIIIK